MTREPWRCLGACLKWAALPAAVFALMSELWLNDLLPRSYRGQLWTIVMAVSMTLIVAYMKRGPWRESSAGSSSLFCAGRGADVASGSMNEGRPQFNW